MERWTEIARRIQPEPWKRPGTDKTWVLNALSQHLLFSRESAERPACRSPLAASRALAALREADVDFVVVGVSGIDFYARTPGEVFATVLGTLLRPAAENLAAALRVLSGIGYTFEAGAEPFVDLADAEMLSRVVSRGAALTAIHPDEGQIDLMTSMAGFGYDELASGATTFRVAEVEFEWVGSRSSFARRSAAADRSTSSSCGPSQRGSRAKGRADGKAAGANSPALPRRSLWSGTPSRTRKAAGGVLVSLGVGSADRGSLSGSRMVMASRAGANE